MIRCTYKKLPLWYQEMFVKLLSENFPGKKEIQSQIESADFEILDNNKGLYIFPTINVIAPVVQTIPVEAIADGEDGVYIEVLLYTSNKKAMYLEILKADGSEVIMLPTIDNFQVMVLNG